MRESLPSHPNKLHTHTHTHTHIIVLSTTPHLRGAQNVGRQEASFGFAFGFGSRWLTGLLLQ